jgi:hypothetical protein
METLQGLATAVFEPHILGSLSSSRPALMSKPATAPMAKKTSHLEGVPAVAGAANWASHGRKTTSAVEVYSAEVWFSAAPVVGKSRNL